MARDKDPNDRNLIGRFVDDLSSKDARRIVELLLEIFAYRPADVDEALKLKARNRMKLLASLLKESDAPWHIREVLLNLARALYYSDEPYHPYYTETLVELMTKASNEVQRPELGPVFEKAVNELSRSKDHTGLVLGDDLIKADAEVRQIASEIVEAVLESKGPDYFTTSEKTALTGVVLPSTRRKLMGE